MAGHTLDFLAFLAGLNLAQESLLERGLIPHAQSRAQFLPYTCIELMLIRNHTIHPTVLSELKKRFKSNSVMLKTDTQLVFLCGRRHDPDRQSGREIILNYANGHLTDYHLFLAEDFFLAFENHTKKDLLSIESKLSSYSDCILIVLESESTFAELGAFAMRDELAKMILLVNDKEFIKEPSFINLGPVAKINKKSKFRPAINTNLSAILDSITEIQSRLEKIVRVKRKRIRIDSWDNFNNLTGKLRLLLLLDLVTLLHPIKKVELITTLKEIIGDGRYNISFELSLLEALQLVKRSEEYYLRTTKDLQFFFDFIGLDLKILRTWHFNHYQKYNKKRVLHLNKKLFKAKN